MLVAEGVLSGVPDLHCYVATQGYHSLYIEMKKPVSGRVSKEQKLLIDNLRECGHKVVICRSATQALEEILSYLGIIK